VITLIGACRDATRPPSELIVCQMTAHKALIALIRFVAVDDHLVVGKL
jgi:hypothetical protein